MFLIHSLYEYRILHTEFQKEEKGQIKVKRKNEEEEMKRYIKEGAGEKKN